MFGRHLGFFRQSKVGERNKFLPRGWLVGEKKEVGGGVEEKIVARSRTKSVFACPNPYPHPL